VARPARPTASSTSRISRRAGRRPASRSGSATLSFAVSDRQQVERLEDEADPVPAQQRQPRLAERAQLMPGQPDLARRGPVKPGRALQQRALPEPEGPITAV